MAAGAGHRAGYRAASLVRHPPPALAGTYDPDGTVRFTDSEVASAEAYWTDAAVADASAAVMPTNVEGAPDSTSLLPKGPEECYLGGTADGAMPWATCESLTTTAAASQGVTTQGYDTLHHCRDNPNLALNNWGCPWWAPGDSTYNYEKPWIVNGRVLFTDYRDGLRKSCSGTSVTTYKSSTDRGNQSLVWTAGHCLAPGGNDQRYFDNVVFIPGFKDGRRPHGTWAARAIGAPHWRKYGNLRHDYAVFVVTKKTFSGTQYTLRGKVGAANIKFNAKNRETDYHLHGYPVERTIKEPFNGDRLWKCYSVYSSGWWPPGSGPVGLGVGCEMWKGASGGGWFHPRNDTYGGTIRSNNSTARSVNTANGPDPFRFYGPYLGTSAKNLWNSARGW